MPTNPNKMTQFSTIREDFASRIMASLMREPIPGNMKVREWMMISARSSVRAADCLIAALNEIPSGKPESKLESEATEA